MVQNANRSCILYCIVANLKIINLLSDDILIPGSKVPVQNLEAIYMEKLNIFTMLINDLKFGYF